MFRQPEDSASKEVSLDYEQLSGNLEDRVLAIYVEYRPRLFRYMRRLGVHRDDAEELIHETFLRLIHRLQQEGQIGSVEGWIIRVTHNLSIDLLLKNGRDESRIQETSEHEWARFVDPGMNPEEELMKQQKKKKMEVALSGMSPQHRSCFLMRVQGFRYKDIGTALGVSGQRAALIVKQVAVRLGGGLWLISPDGFSGPSCPRRKSTSPTSSSRTSSAMKDDFWTAWLHGSISRSAGGANSARRSSKALVRIRH